MTTKHGVRCRKIQTIRNFKNDKGTEVEILLKYAKTAPILNYFECYFIYTKVCMVYYICLFWLRDFENARAGRKVTLIVRFISC